MQPSTTTKFTTTTSNASHFCSFLTDAYLTHLHFYLKLSCEYSNQFSKINTIIGGIKESSFFTICLNFYLTQFHLQSKVPCMRATFCKYICLSAFTNFKSFNISFVTWSKNFFDFNASFFYASFFKLQPYQFACQTNFT